MHHYQYSKKSSILKFNLKVQQTLGSPELKSHGHLWQHPPKNSWIHFSFPEFVPAWKNHFIPSVHFWVLWPDWPHPLLTMPTARNPLPKWQSQLSCFFGWMGDHATFDVLFYLRIICIYTCQALVPWYQKDLNVCFMQKGVRFTEVWHIMWFSTGTLIWYHKYTNRHGTLRGQQTDTPI